MQATPPRDEDFFTHFPEEDDSSPAPASTLQPPPTSSPSETSLPLPITPIDVVQLSDDTESGVDGDNDEEGEVDWVTTEGESICKDWT